MRRLLAAAALTTLAACGGDVTPPLPPPMVLLGDYTLVAVAGNPPPYADHPERAGLPACFAPDVHMIQGGLLSLTTLENESEGTAWSGRFSGYNVEICRAPDGEVYDFDKPGYLSGGWAVQQDNGAVAFWDDGTIGPPFYPTVSYSPARDSVFITIPGYPDRTYAMALN